MDSLSPNGLTQDAKGVISAISRQELVNLYVVSHVDRVTDRIRVLGREAETVHAQCSVKLVHFYQSLFLEVDERVMAAGATIRAAMTAVGVQVDEVGGGFYAPTRELRFGADYINYLEPDRHNGHGGRSFRNGREVNRPPLHDLVAEVVQGRIGATEDGKYPWTADVVLFRTGKHALQEVCRVELPMVLTIQPTEKMRALYAELNRVRDELHRLKESIKDVPALERSALAALTRRSLEAQGITLELPLLEIGGGVR